MDPEGVHRWWDGWNWTTQTQASTAQPAVAAQAQTRAPNAAVSTRSRPPSGNRKGRPLASIPLRAAARTIDFVLAMLLATSAHRLWAPLLLGEDAKPTKGLLSEADLVPEDLAPTALLATVIIFVVWELYWLLAEGATPGKQLMGLYVSDPTSQRGTVEAVPAIKRNLHRAIAVVPFGWLIVAATSLASLVLMQSDTARRQSLMDRVAGTTVHRLAPGSPRWTPWLRVWVRLFVVLRVGDWLYN